MSLNGSLPWLGLAVLPVPISLRALQLAYLEKPSTLCMSQTCMSQSMSQRRNFINWRGSKKQEYKLP